jgi:type IV pilus assembly protein PilM
MFGGLVMHLNELFGPGLETGIGIDTGHTNIRIIQLGHLRGRTTLINAIKIPTPAGTITDSSISNTSLIASLLQTHLISNGIHADCSAWCISGAGVVMRSIRMPALPDAALAKTISYELPRLVPNQVDPHQHYCIAAQVESPDATPGTASDILAAAVPKSAVAERTELCRLIGLHPERIDVHPIAIRRALSSFVSPDVAGHIVTIDVGAATAMLTIFEDGCWRFTRALPIQTAVEVAQPFGFGPAVDATNSDAWIDNLCREVRRTLHYYQTQDANITDLPIAAVVLTGGRALHPRLFATIKHELATAVYVTDPFRASGVDVPLDLQSVIASDEPAWALAVGLALGLQPAKYRVTPRGKAA